MTPCAREVRRAIFEAFAATGAPPSTAALEPALLTELERLHILVLRHGAIHMAHPFAGHHDATCVRAPDDRTWWGNCAWDGLGIVAALGLTDAHVDSGGVMLHVRDGDVIGDARFHVAVPARHWWDDIEHT